MKIVINADDFGMTHSRNTAIDCLMRKGICTNASLVVNMPWTEEAVKMAFEGGYEDKISLHLNLTVGEPLTDRIKANSLYCNDDQFVYRPIIKKVKQILPFHVRAIRQELEAQIIRFCDLGLKIRSIDSHNWVHLRLPVWLALLPLIKKYNIRMVRPMWKGYRRPEIASKRWSRYFCFIEPFILKKKQCKVVCHTSNIEQFLAVREQMPNGSIVEVFTHPDLIDDKIMDTSSSYLKKAMCSVEENVAKLDDYTAFYISEIKEK